MHILQDFALMQTSNGGKVVGGVWVTLCCDSRYGSLGLRPRLDHHLDLQPSYFAL